MNTWLPFFIQTPVFCEIFFKNISLSRPLGFLYNFSSCWTCSNDCKEVLPLHLFSRLAITRAPAGLVTITNQKTGPFSRVFSQNVRNFPDVIIFKCNSTSFENIFTFLHLPISSYDPKNKTGALQILTDEWLESQKNNPAAEIKGDYIYLYELTKTGKRKVVMCGNKWFCFSVKNR